MTIVDTAISVISGMALLGIGYVIGFTVATHRAVVMMRETCRKFGAEVKS